jgi:mRNA (guanine-N7-)-methyltransferase
MNNLRDDLVKLDINDLLNCLTTGTVKVPPHENAKIVFDKYLINISTRSQSSIFKMRLFHNWVKETLIVNTIREYYSGTTEKINLLDIAVGRGGDLFKWDSAWVSNVFGFDVSSESINEQSITAPGALARLAKFTNPKHLEHIEFHVGNAVKPSKKLISSLESFIQKYGQFQIVSCQFALHYFFKSKPDLENVLKLVSETLKPGGYFIGTAVDGNRVRELLGTSDVYDSKLFTINKVSFKKRDPFGNRYTFTIKDSTDQTNYFNTMGVSTEYLVNFDILEEMAKYYHLSVVKLNFFEEYSPDKFTTLRENHLPFNDIVTFYRGKKVSPDELEISSLNSVFVFKKIN